MICKFLFHFNPFPNNHSKYSNRNFAKKTGWPGSCLRRPSKPLFLSEVPQHPTKNENDQYPNSRIAIFPVQFGHVGEVHPIDACNKSQWNKNCCHDGQCLHDLVHAVALHRKKQVRIAFQCSMQNFATVELYKELNIGYIHNCLSGKDKLSRVLFFSVQAGYDS